MDELTPMGSWRTRTTFVLALSASAVGLGNLWRFSYLAGEHGGGPFVLAYLVCLFGIATPILIAEVVIGNHGRSSPVASLRHAADRSLRSRAWMIGGVLLCLTAVLIMGYYSVVAGWALAYVKYMQSGHFSDASAVMVGEFFQRFLSDPSRLIRWHTAFLFMVLAVVCLGVRRGLGVLVWLSVPALIALLSALVVFALDQGDLAAAEEFLFHVQPLDFSARSWMVALGQAFYTLSVGVGVGISYGAYAPERIPIGRSVFAVALFDTLIALAAGLAIFPIVFANNIEPSMGPGLMFVSLPYAFGNTVEGELFGTLFFGLVVVAALGSAVALVEPVVAALMQQFKWRRFTAVVMVGAIIWLLGIGVALSFSLWQDLSWLGYRNLFELLVALTTSFLLPLGALLVALFVGWQVRPQILRELLARETDLFFSIWYFVLRYIAPPAIVAVFVSAVIFA
ncbi:MAG: NSS family neurotransmitter:Na+ symporter [Halieaceae bacterium]|jgi:NSS family neurotransmitter:Na+ symporter